MASKRQRTRRTLGNIVLDTAQKTNAVEPGKGKTRDSIPKEALAENSVDTRALAPDSVDNASIARGAVSTENLGSINQIESDGNLIINVPTGNSVVVNGPITASKLLLTDGAESSYPRLEYLYPARHSTSINGWKTHNNTNANDQYEAPYATIVDGMVYLGGLIAGGTIDSGTVIANLPAAYRPLKRVFVGVDNNGSRAVEIRPNGEVVLAASGSASYLSLNNVSYPTAETDALYTNVGSSGSQSSFSANWAAHSSTTGGSPTNPPGFYQDKYGLAYLRGMIVKSTAPTANESMFTLPPSFYIYGSNEIHVGTSETGAYGQYSLASATVPEPIARWKTGVTKSSWLTLDSGPISLDNYSGLPFPYKSGTLPIDWRRPIMLNSWVTHTAGSYPEPKYAKTAEGLVILSGFIKSGTNNAAIFNLPVGFRPAAGLIFNSTANNARSRITVFPDGNILQNTGSNVWVSLDGLAFPAQQ